MEDPTALIKLIEERPCIWDKTCNREIGEKKKAWREICRSFTQDDFDNMEEEEQKKLEDSLQGKWKNLRDTFLKSIRMNSMQQYKHYDILEFLLKNPINPRKQLTPPSCLTGSSIEPRTQLQLKRSSLSYSKELANKRKQPFGRIKPHIVNSYVSQQNLKKELPPPESTTSNVNSTSELHEKDDTLDHDEAFFISIMPSIKKFSDAEKLDFRIGVLKTIKEINEKEMAASISRCSTNDGLEEMKDEVLVPDSD